MWSQNVKFFKLTEIGYRGRLLYTYFDFIAYFFKILIIHIFFGQIWSQSLKFFKLTEMLYRGAMLYAYYNFNVNFFKILVIYIFWANLVPKSEVLHID